MEIYDYGTLIATGFPDGNGGGSIEFVDADGTDVMHGDNGALKQQMMALGVLSGDGWDVVSSTVVLTGGTPVTRYLVRRPTPSSR